MRNVVTSILTVGGLLYSALANPVPAEGNELTSRGTTDVSSIFAQIDAHASAIGTSSS